MAMAAHDLETRTVGRGILGVGFVGLTIILAGVGAIIPTWQQRQDYEQGVAALEAGNCDRAIAAFDRVIERNLPIDLNGTASGARTRRALCETLLTARQYRTSKQWNWTLAEYLRLNSTLNDTGLGQTVTAFNREIETAVRSAFGNASAGSLVNPITCLQLDRAIGQQLVRASEPDLPPLLFTCGRMYANRQEFGKAIAAFTTLVTRYPNHSLAPQGHVSLKYSRARLRASEQGIVTASRPPGAIVFTTGRREIDPLRWVRILATSFVTLALIAIATLVWQALRAAWGRRTELPSDPFEPIPPSVTSLQRPPEALPSDTNA
ncbi:MAG: tetratricopeptide repeat protein [Cyanobacteria bacterium]|nr:tetratricopeptide repeat protein [Cyanobacteriota bacterium]